MRNQLEKSKKFSIFLISKKRFTMAIVIKTAEEIEGMRKACRLASEVLDFIEPFVVPGAKTIA